MAGTYYSGRGGSVSFPGAAAMVGAKAWTINAEGDTSEYNNWSSTNTWTSRLKGLRRWSGTFTADLNQNVAAIEVFTVGAATFETGGSQNWAGAITITGASNGAQRSGDVIEIEYTFVGSGTLTRPAATTASVDS